MEKSYSKFLRAFQIVRPPSTDRWAILRALVASAILSWVPSVGLAQPLIPLETLEGRYRVGIELEITPRFLAQGIHLFDFDRYQAQLMDEAGAWPVIAMQIPRRWVEEYLVSEEHLNDLPERIRQRLLAGLEASRPVVLHGQVNIPQEVRVPQTGIQSPRAQGGRVGEIISPGTAERHSSSTQDQNRGILISGSGGGSAVGSGNQGLIVSQSTRQAARWSEIQRRWRALRPAESAMAIKLSRLPGRLLAELCVRSRSAGWPESAPVPIGQVPLRRDLPEQVLQLFSNWEWVNDGGTVEFRMRGEGSTALREVVSQTMSIARLFGVDRYRGLGGSTDRGLPYADESPTIHIHQSRTDWRSLRGAAEVENFCRLVWGLELNEALLAVHGTVFYQHLIAFRGLVRLVQVDSGGRASHPADSRKESRYLQAPLETELSRVLSINERPAEYFEAAIGRLTPAMVDQIFDAPDFGAERLAGNLAGIMESCSECASSRALHALLATFLPRLLVRPPTDSMFDGGITHLVAKILRALSDNAPTASGASGRPWTNREFLRLFLARARADGGGEGASLLLHSSRELNGVVLREVLHTNKSNLSAEDRAFWFFRIRVNHLSAEERVLYLREYMDHFFATRIGSNHRSGIIDGLRQLPRLTTEEAEIVAPLLNRGGNSSEAIQRLVQILGSVEALGPRAQAEIERFLAQYGGLTEARELRVSFERSRQARSGEEATPGNATGGDNAGSASECESLQSSRSRLQRR